MTMTIDIGQVDSMFKKIADIVQETDYSQALQEFHQVIADVDRESFSGEHEPGGTAWVGPSPMIAQEKGTRQSLFQNGALMASLVEVGGNGNINSTSPHESLYGSDSPDGMDHETGTSKMPAGPAVEIANGAVEILAERVTNATIEAMRSL